MTYKVAVDRFILNIFFTLHKAKRTCSDHEKTKATFTILRTVCEGGLPNYFCFFSCRYFFFWCMIIFFIYLFLFFFFLDINECVRGLHKCSSDAFCNNSKGSNNCTCKHGFKRNRRECKGRRWIH